MAHIGSKTIADIEIMLKTGRGSCNHWLPSYMGGRSCNLTRRIPDEKIKICNNCPLWHSLDVTYEDIHGVHIVETYDWWRNEWIRNGQVYAKDRMVDFVTTWIEPPNPPNMASTRPRFGIEPPSLTFMRGVVVGMVLVILFLQLIYL